MPDRKSENLFQQELFDRKDYSRLSHYQQLLYNLLNNSVIDKDPGAIMDVLTTAARFTDQTSVKNMDERIDFLKRYGTKYLARNDRMSEETWEIFILALMLDQTTPAEKRNDVPFCWLTEAATEDWSPLPLERLEQVLKIVDLNDKQQVEFLEEYNYGGGKYVEKYVEAIYKTQENSFYVIRQYITKYLNNLSERDESIFQEEPSNTEAFLAILLNIPIYKPVQKQFALLQLYASNEKEHLIAEKYLITDWYNACLFVRKTQHYAENREEVDPEAFKERKSLFASIGRLCSRSLLPSQMIYIFLIRRLAQVWLHNEEGMQEMIEDVAPVLNNVRDLVNLLAEVAEGAKEDDLYLQPDIEIAKSKRKKCVEFALFFQSFFDDEKEVGKFFRTFINILLLDINEADLDHIVDVVKAWLVENKGARSKAISGEWKEYEKQVRSSLAYGSKSDYADVKHAKDILQKWTPKSFSLEK